jgi:glycosyltransferase involved in cell wall biosynthesis
MPNPSVLIVSYLFPPMGGIAVQRALSLARYLPRCGYEVHVLKARNAAGPVYDPSLLNHVPDSISIHSAFTPEIPFELRQKIWKWMSRGTGSAGPSSSSTAKPARGPSLATRLAQRVFCPEPEILWVPFAVRAARSIVRRHSIDVVLVTAPPFSAFLVGTAVKGSFPNVKLISDFRDEWLTFYLNNNEFQSSAHTRRRAAEIERATVQLSDLVVAVTESSLQEIRGRYPEQPDAKFRCLPNGYDPMVFADFRPRQHEGKKVIVTHVGTVYKNASPRFYLQALDNLPEEVRDRFETRFIGRVADSERPFLEASRSALRILGFMPQAEAFRYMEETDYLLLTMTDSISMPGKFYEYMATGKPILALSPPNGEVQQILRETGAGWCVEPGDQPAIRQMLLRASGQPQTGRCEYQPDWEAIRRYERPRLVEEYGGLIREILESAQTVTE